jgi:hypothetical protein
LVWELLRILAEWLHQLLQFELTINKGEQIIL